MRQLQKACDMLQNLRAQVQRQPSAVPSPARWWVGSIGLAVAVGIAYFLAARLSLALLTKPDGVAVFWPASGVAAGVLIALGPGARWPVAAGAMVATIVANLLGDRTLLGSFVFALCNAAEALITAGLIERYFGSRFQPRPAAPRAGTACGSNRRRPPFRASAGPWGSITSTARRHRYSRPGSTGSRPTHSASSRLHRC